MHTSSNTRSKAPFVPWLAALVLGATAHAGWLIHDLREGDEIDARPLHVSLDIEALAHEAATTPTPAARPHPRCRHANAVEVVDELDDLDLWIHRTDRYLYTIDRRLLDQVALADANPLAWAGPSAVADDTGGLIELRNIRCGTPLYMLGLRNGDRLFAIARHGDSGVERVELSIERRGAPLLLTYEIV